MIRSILALLFLCVSGSKAATPSCSYDGRGSLSSTCYNANAAYFRRTSYRFDNLDETVRCVNCSLQIIDSNTFDISSNEIRYLILNDTQITVLQPKSFIGLVFLRKLILSNNNIISVPPETFQGIAKVEELDMEYNSITSLKENGFKELTNLRKLNLKDNRIKTIENGTFAGLASLNELNLANNDIINMATIFTGLESVALINVEGNQIVDFPAQDMPIMRMLTQLNIAKNSLKTISGNNFLSFPRLENLNLSSNPIDNIEMGAFRGLDKLETLDLSKGAIGNIPKGLLSSLHELRFLDLSNNRLAVFQTGVFSGLPELRKLNISHNKITTYEKTGIFPLHSLHILDLSYNSLEDLDYKLLVNHLPSLSYIGLKNNPWPCYLKKEMEELFVHDNLVFDLGKINLKEKCNDTRSKVVEPLVKEPMKMDEPKPNSSTHDYALYIFIVLGIIAIITLFAMQMRNRRDIKNIIGRYNVAETHLISHNMEDNY